jgi:polyisoprenoid-binding protein YceI
MQFPTGTFTLSNANGSLKIRTGRQGLGAKAGHDLLLQAARWEAVTKSEGASPEVTAEVDLQSLQVLEGTGGMKALTDGDRIEIKKDLEKKILETDRFPKMAFLGKEWKVLSEDATHVRGTLSGELELHGQRSPVALDVDVQRVDGVIQVKATTDVVQSKWGIKLFTAFLGALKVADPVKIEIDATVAGT